MYSLMVVTRDSQEHHIKAGVGLSVMEIIRNAGIDELSALCGGSMSCATCHIYIDPDFLNRMPPMSDSENEMLDCSDHRDARSRLSCQIPFTAGLDGLRVDIARED